MIYIYTYILSISTSTLHISINIHIHVHIYIVLNNVLKIVLNCNVLNLTIQDYIIIIITCNYIII